MKMSKQITRTLILISGLIAALLMILAKHHVHVVLEILFAVLLGTTLFLVLRDGVMWYQLRKILRRDVYTVIESRKALGWFKRIMNLFFLIAYVIILMLAELDYENITIFSIGFLNLFNLNNGFVAPRLLLGKTSIVIGDETLKPEAFIGFHVEKTSNKASTVTICTERQRYMYLLYQEQIRQIRNTGILELQELPMNVTHNRTTKKEKTHAL